MGRGHCKLPERVLQLPERVLRLKWAIGQTFVAGRLGVGKNASVDGHLLLAR